MEVVAVFSGHTVDRLENVDYKAVMSARLARFDASTHEDLQCIWQFCVTVLALGIQGAAKTCMGLQMELVLMPADIFR